MMGRVPGAGVMRELEGRAEAVAGSFNAQDLANTLWAAWVFSVFRSPWEEVRLVRTAVQHVLCLDRTGCLNTANMCQVHQFFAWYSVATRLGVEAIHDMQSLKATCRSAFEGHRQIHLQPKSK